MRDHLSAVRAAGFKRRRTILRGNFTSPVEAAAE
jgi:hypothetical protein